MKSTSGCHDKFSRPLLNLAPLSFINHFPLEAWAVGRLLDPPACRHTCRHGASSEPRAVRVRAAHERTRASERGAGAAPSAANAWRADPDSAGYRLLLRRPAEGRARGLSPLSRFSEVSEQWVRSRLQLPSSALPRGGSWLSVLQRVGGQRRVNERTGGCETVSGTRRARRTGERGREGRRRRRSRCKGAAAEQRGGSFRERPPRFRDAARGSPPTARKVFSR